MSEFEDLMNAILSLNKRITNFSIGAVSLDDFKPTEERIKETRESLKHLNARVLILKAQNEFQLDNEESEENGKDVITNLSEATADSLINNAAIKLCLHSYTIQAILAGKQGDSDMQKKIYACMRKLFSLNDNILSVQEDIENALQKQLELKIQCQNALFDYKNFLTEQEEIRVKKLQETNPQMVQLKKKINGSIRNINIMKQLILNFIAASSYMLSKEPFFADMLQKHRELINTETILKLAQPSAEGENSEAVNDTQN